MLSINTNYSSLMAQTFLNRNNLELDKVSARIASGKRINRAMDDRK